MVSPTDRTRPHESTMFTVPTGHQVPTWEGVGIITLFEVRGYSGGRRERHTVHEVRR